MYMASSSYDGIPHCYTYVIWGHVILRCMYSIKQHSKLYTVTQENCSTSVRIAVMPSYRPG